MKYLDNHHIINFQKNLKKVITAAEFVYGTHTHL